MKIYLVGGAVRDKLLGLPVKDRDWVVVGATAGEMRRRGYRQVGKDFPVFLDPDSQEEYALARTERKSGRGHTGFVVHASPEVSLEEDLRRRDLTINALAEDPAGGVIDPYGGQRDIERKLLRHVSPAFSEDPLRVLRTARFAARFDHLGFRVADETRELMRAMVAQGELDTLVPERVWQEVERALSEARPRAFIEVLRDCGALEIILPELARLFGLPLDTNEHPEGDCGLHCLMALDQACRLSEDPMVRGAALLHDLGRAVAPPSGDPGQSTHTHSGVAVVDALCERLRTPAAFRELARLACAQHLACHRALDLEPEALLTLLESSDAFRRPERFDKLLLACAACWRGREGREGAAYPQARHLRAARDLAATIDTKEIIAAGFRKAEIGEQLRRRRLAALENLRGAGRRGRKQS